MKIKSTYLTLTAALVLATVFLAQACRNDSPENQARKEGQEIWFGEILHEYGEIAEDSDGSCVFAFKNIGEEPIVINRVRSTCGCTVPQWPREPIEPGASGEIKVVYNTANPGSFYKSIYVYSSAANSPVKLQIKGKVIPTDS